MKIILIYIIGFVITMYVWIKFKLDEGGLAQPPASIAALFWPLILFLFILVSIPIFIENIMRNEK